MTNNGLSKHQRDKQRLKDVKSNHAFFIPTKGQARERRKSTPDQVYADDSPIWRHR